MLRKCGAAERALCEGHHGGLSLLWKAIEMVFLYISLGIDNLDISMKNSISVEILIDFQFIRNLIRRITVIL